MAKELHTGLVIEGETLDWARLQGGREGLQVAGQGVESLPPAATGGEAVAREVRLASALKALAPTIKGRLSLGVASDQLLLRVLRLPSTDDAEVAGMVAFQAEKLAPFPTDTMVVGHEVLQRAADASVVLVAAVRTAFVEAVGADLKKAGLAAARVDAVVLGWWRLLQDGHHVGKGGCQLDVVMADQSPLLIGSRHGIPLAFRALPADARGAIDPGELSRELGFTLVSLELEQGQLEKPQVTVWADEGQAADWREAFTSAYGDGVRFMALADLGHPAEGLARRGAEAGTLDLTPDSWKQVRARSAFRRQIVMGCGVIMGVWLLAVGGALGYLGIENLRLRQIQAERDTLTKPALAVRETRRRVFMVQQYMSSSNSALESLREVTVLMPPAGIELTSYAFYKGEDLKLSGEAENTAVVYDFKNRLDSSPFFREATLQGPRKAQSGREVFDVVLKLAGDTP